MTKTLKEDLAWFMIEIDFFSKILDFVYPGLPGICSHPQLNRWRILAKLKYLPTPINN